MTSITQISRMLGKFGDDMVFAFINVCAAAMQPGCGGDGRITVGAEELLRGRKSKCRSGRATAPDESGDVSIIKVW